MTKLSFFTPVTYLNPPKSIGSSLLEKVDNYFYLGGKKAHVIQGRTKTGQEKAVLSENKASLLERIGKVISYLTLIIPLLMLIAKAILRSTHSFKIIDTKKKLEKGINVCEETAAKIERLLPKILRRDNDEEIEWLSKANNLVFKLNQHPQLVFKIPPMLRNHEIKTRFENMVKAKGVCLAHELNLLVIPHAKKITVNDEGVAYNLIVEESLDFSSNESIHEELYHNYSSELNETARQLAIFVAKTGFNDVTWRNIPILKEAQGFQGPRRVALIDLEHMNSRVNGFLGDGNGSCGLIRCVSEAQIDLVIAEARKQGVSITDREARDAKNHRLEELESDKKLRTFYEKKGIVAGKEPLQVDLESLGLDLTEEGQAYCFPEKKDDESIVLSGGLRFKSHPVTLRKCTEDVVAEINRLIEKSSNQASIKGKRYFVLSTNTEHMRKYIKVGVPFDQFFISEEDEKKLWLRRIVTALIDKGHIFKLEKVNGHGYFIQA